MLENLKKLFNELLNFLIKLSSALNILIILSPVSVSSKIDKNSPCSFCTFKENFFRAFPIQEIINPETGIKIITKNVNLILIENIIIKVNKIVNGSLIKSSSIDKKEFWISSTSDVILDKISPFFFFE